MNRLYIFLGLFAIVFLLESTGTRYMHTAVQNIERHFQIPSKVSGFLVSGGEIGYLSTVIFISYFGSRGNRAKWIGGSALIMAFALILAASPNFIFPQEQQTLKLTKIEESLNPNNLFSGSNSGNFWNDGSNANLSTYFSYKPIQDRIQSKLRESVLEKISNHIVTKRSLNTSSIDHKKSDYALDEPLMEEAIQHMKQILEGVENEKPLLAILQQFVNNRHLNRDQDIATIRKAANAPFSFCGRLVNDLKEILNNVTCNHKSSNLGPLSLIFIAVIILGACRTISWSLGVPLLDDNVKKNSMPIFFASLAFLRILGPILGYLVGALSNKFYYTSPTPPGLTAKDPLWIGAWWLGFLIVGFATIVPAIVMFFFPSKNSNKYKVSQSDEEKNQLNLYDKHMSEKKRAEEHNVKGSLKTFKSSYRDVLSSKIYIGSVFGRIFDDFALKGYTVFLPKYLENHYGIPQYRVHLYMSAFGVFGLALGTVTGGFITRKFKLNGRKVALFLLLCSTLNVLIFLVKIFLGCNSIVNSVGVEGVQTHFNYSKTCNIECGCEDAKLFPVCDTTGKVYFSPCHAGCRKANVIDLTNQTVKKEFCKDDCQLMTVLFLITTLLGAFVAGCGVVPGMLILIRSVPPSTRSIAIGLQGFMVSLLGSLPSPMLWGAIVDSACLVWEQTCGKGACTIYDPFSLRLRMNLLYAGLRSFSILADIYVFYQAKNLNIFEDPEENIETEEDKNKGNERGKNEFVPMTKLH
uniref:Solute carrier organic anion transporter family member n=1 Tax=Acrobeloides nanus TaxID=290746 RepID=A0A914DX70_9BILA